MGPFRLRSLLLTAAVISNCITWTASRHHYTHNVSGHRSRHRRQGAGLYLPASYVIPGGEGGGAWGEWGEVSPCSRTCGGGVASQKRICLEVGPDGRPACTGGDTKYFSCQTQDCPEGTGDFRAEQCSQHNDETFRGVRYTWVPYTKAPNPCELNCMPRGERFYYRHAQKVVDGTRCNDESFDVCVDGTCQPVGCDMMLGSNAREDKCRECRGNNTNCRTVAGNIPPDHELRQGYNDVLLIPAGATSIYIYEVRNSNNYLALRSKRDNVYYLNGDYHIDFPRTLEIAGALWHYERSQQGFAAPDKLRCQGPTNEPLYLSILLQDENVGIEYEYSVPTSVQPPPDQQYNWVHDDFSPCSATCGGGWQTRNVTCRSREDLEEVEDTLCDDGLKPPTNQTCNSQPCAARWVEGPWSPCSRPCGQGGTRSRQVHCEKVITNGYPSIVGDKECFDLLGPKPELYQECNKEASCPLWYTGPWKPCDKLCGEGKQTRKVVCYQKDERGRIEVLQDDACADERPPAEQPCTLHPCEGVDWVLSEWSGCDTCTSTIRSRSAMCVTKDQEIVNSTFCAYHPAPVLEEPCDKTKLPACEVQWYATQWSNCSVQCGKGIQTRKVFCGLFDGSAVLKVDDGRCAKDDKYNDTKSCEIPAEKCPAKWYAGPWSECTKECGGGEQYRKVMCLIGDKASNACDEDTYLDSTQACNKGPCDKDETLPVDSSSTPIMDEDYEDEECEEGDYEEVGAEEEEEEEETGTTPEDMMFSDSPSTYEGSGFTAFTEIESEFTEGSGAESTITTIEASGSEPTETTETGETEETGSTESSATEETGSTEPSGSTESGATEETSITETTESGPTSESSATEESGATDSSSDSSSDTSDSSTEIVSESGSTDISTTESGLTESSSLSSDITTSSDFTTESETYSTELSSASSTESDLSTTETATSLESESTTESLTSGSSEESTDISTTESSTEVSGSSETSESEATEESGSTESSGTEASTTEGETESPGSTETSITESTVSGETEESGATTESGPTSESGPTESEGTTETGITESTETGETGSSESEATSESGATESTLEVSSTSESSDGSTTEWSWSSTIEDLTTKRAPRCKLKKKKSKCVKSKFGCCPDKRTPAAGPFDEGCPTPKTCKESKHGCCPDGVSPAAGPKNDGCPTVPCKETLFGCCKSDNKTPAEGNDQEGCPPPPPACKSSKYGCCKDGKTQATGPKKKGCPEKEPKKGCAKAKFGCCPDKKTEATGPNGEGCPCDTSEFGCCPDGVSLARGPQMEGCVMSCNTSAYGCCPDKETPAHGPDFEGCCLQYPFGCCPDNYKPAEGPHMEGCGCQFARFGCCPDNVTIARGPNNEGCGCQYTEHGCCPDRHTEATGPEYEGCGCHTYQFGCCPDGTTIAKGPNLQGCHCRQSKYGCCGDGQTAAAGPDQAGCDCSSSQFGCCPDGQTEAKGEKFLGCTDVPENRQAACSLPTDRGPCRNYSVYWFYDMEYGGCSRFWYGGCEGNGNRFTSKEECDDVCVQPSPKDACKLPKVKGACQGYHLRWYYDPARESCGQFVFGGCLGNANNFDSRELCQERCEPARSNDVCKLPIERGSCAGNFGRWGFNPETRRCEQFIWGGCEGNGNRFNSEAACVMRCDPPGALQPECSEPQDAGNCTEKLATWSFHQTENRCVPFYYTGCGGNGNRFQSEQECAEACPSAYVQDVCTMPALTGDCADYRERWYYDTADKRCRQFYYGGCGGNGNNFATERECEGRCREETRPTTTLAPQEPEPFRQEFCFLEKDAGPCSQSETRWAYDAARGDCTPFEYGGCGGNRNSFPSREYCQYYCMQTQDICQLPMRAGPCSESQTRFFYDPASDSCSQFAYSGCDGNANNFASIDECERRCRSGAPASATTTTVAPVTEAEVIPRECYAPESLEECSGEGQVWYYDAAARGCVAHQNSAPGSGPYCRNTGVFHSEEACQRTCGAFRGLDVCRYPLDPGPCRAFVPKFFFEQETGECQPFTYGGCHGGPNRFSSAEECRQLCVRETDPCKQRVQPGNCLGYEVKWYFDETRDSCAQFVYTGCDGNDNRFDSQQECEGQCRRQPPAEATTPRGPPPSPVAEVCRTPDSLEPCGQNITVYYYDEESSSCKHGEFGGCRYANSYRTEEECERNCGAFRGLDVCNAPLDPGPCRAAFPKYYWDAGTGSCQLYTYGGCGGGPNRFSSPEECDEVCGENAPDSNEIVPDCSAYVEECRSIQCPYSVQRRRTAGGCERCSCVPVEVDCAPLRLDCERLKCTYGVERTQGDDGCERCRCIEHPCAGKECPAGERCVANAYRDPLTQEPQYAADCRTMNKPGSCPLEQLPESVTASCRRECNDDADCRGAGKCCAAGCSQLCLEPAAPTSPRPAYTTQSPELPQAPQANPRTEPQVTSSEGGVATLRCLFHGNPPPKITWRRGEITIDGDVGRYRLLSDGALEIVSLYRNDSGVYICVADNGLGVARQEIHLQVNDPVEGPAGISGEPAAAVTGELGQALTLRCLTFGHPEPSIYWYRGLTGPLVPFSSTLYEARGNTLLIRQLNAETLGEYACQAYNGIGKPASWSVVVQAWRAEGGPEGPFLVSRGAGAAGAEVVVTPRPRPTEPPRPPDAQVPVYTVPVTTRITSEAIVAAPGSELSIPCEVDGYPTPDVYWSKDGARLAPTDRVQPTEARLTIRNVSPGDGGVYGCHASNAYGSDYATLQVTVQGLYIPAKCTDNPFFADCKLIVRSKFCQHKYYSKFCCKSCVEAGQLNPADLDMQADEPYRKK